ncbi:MAG: DUF6049 family protein, partial [Pseudonocardia sp.]|nr:DUF6049 family protein [Pseudonocardia sp.]
MRPATRASVMVAIILLTLTGLLLGGPALATPPVADTGGPLRLVLDDITPRVVTTGGPGALTVTGTLTNTGDTPVEDLVVRVQRGDPLETEGELRDALGGTAPTDAVAPQFVPVAGSLPPGGTAPVRLTVALRGDPQASLALVRTGVHELLVNVNGVPRGGARARLAAVRLLLPVLSLPGPAQEEPAATPFSLLYPITDTPRRISTVPGQTLLADDGLATSFAPGGRLDALLSAVEDHAPAGSPVRNALCLAVDPDLAQTAADMRGSYQVAVPGGVPTPGTGSEAARAWLERLMGLARDRCVIALPYADADLVALTRGGLGDTAAAAVSDGREVLATVLQTPLVPDVTWPADGLVDAPTLEVVSAAGTRALVLSADGLEPGRTRPAAGAVPIAGGPTSQFAVLTDPLLALAMSGPTSTDIPDARAGSAASASSPAGTGTPLATQDAIGTLAFRAATTSTTDGAPLVLAPPHDWAAGAPALLAAAGQLLDAGRLSPRGLDDVLTAGPPPGTPARPPVYPLDAGGREIPTAVITTIRATSDSLTDLRSAMVDGSGVGIGADEVLAPLLQGLVRPASVARRGQPDLSRDAAKTGATGVADLRAAVRVLEPPSPYSLGTSTAPLPLTVANGLPVTVRVQLDVASTAGLRVASIAPLEIPPLGRRQVSVDAEVTRSGQFTVAAAVRTPDGGLLGPPSRLRVRSTAYGTITVWLTASAGVMLVVLVARRILRRIRGARPPGPRGGGPAGPPPPGGGGGGG